MDIAGILGVDPDVRNGFSAIRVGFDIDAEATKDEIAALVAQSQKRSAVFDIVTNPAQREGLGRLRRPGSPGSTSCHRLADRDHRRRTVRARDEPCARKPRYRPLVLERGRVGNSWRTERWDGLRLLSPNWMNGLPGQPYAGADPDGFMSAPQLVRQFDALCGDQGHADAYRDPGLVGQARWRLIGSQTDQGILTCDSLVIATGACSRPNIPNFASELPAGIAQVSPISYRRPADLAAGRGPGGRGLGVGAPDRPGARAMRGGG